MSSTEFRHYTAAEFLDEFFPDVADRAAIAEGMQQLRSEQRAVERGRSTAARPGRRPSCRRTFEDRDA